MAKKRRTTFLKTQKERARLEKQAEKRARRQGRETDVPGECFTDASGIPGAAQIGTPGRREADDGVDRIGP